MVRNSPHGGSHYAYQPGGTGVGDFPQDFDARQGLAFEPFEEGAAGGRDIGEAAGGAGGIERRHGVAAAGDADKLAGGRQFGRGFGDFDGAVVERLDLERAERAVPDQRL